MSFVVIPTAQNSYIGLKTSFFLITPTPKFCHWHNQFYRIESSSYNSEEKLGDKQILNLMLLVKIVKSFSAYQDTAEILVLTILRPPASFLTLPHP
jgi:hypothetical protein